MTVTSQYKPFPKQAAFHKDKHFAKVLLCGVGFGKTTAAVFEIIKKVFVECPGKKGMVIAPTHKMLMRGMFRIWKDTIPQDWYTFNAVSKEMVIKATNSVIYWESSYDPKRLQGVELSWVAFDEAAVVKDPEVYSELVNRLRDPSGKTEPQIFITTTPVQGWMEDVFGTGPGNGFEGTDDCWYNDNSIVFRATTYDNPALAGTNYIKNILSQPKASPEWIEQNIHAKYVARTGAVFKEFKKDKHVINKLPSNIKKYYAAFDFGYTAPSCLSVFATTDDNKIIIVEEIYKNGTTWDENGWFQDFRKIKEKYGIDVIVADSAHNERIAASNRFFSNRPRIVSSIKKTDESINIMKKMFIEDRMLIMHTCVNTIKEISRWTWESDGQGRPTNKPENGNDHSIDPIRYFTMYLPVTFFTPNKFKMPNRAFF